MEPTSELLIEKLRCGCTANVISPVLRKLVAMLLGGASEFASDRICPECRARGLLAKIQSEADLAGLPRMIHAIETIASGAAYDREANRLASLQLFHRLREEYPPINEDDVFLFSKNESIFAEATRPGQWSAPWSYALMVQLRQGGKH